MKITKSKIFSFLGILLVAGYLSIAAWGEKATVLVYDNTITDADTIVTGWYDIGGAEGVSYWFEVSDSVNATCLPLFKFSGSGQRREAVADSFSILNEAGRTPLGRGSDLRGYATHIWSSAVGMADTNYIEGANLVAFKVTITDMNTNSGTEDSSWVRVGLLMTE